MNNSVWIILVNYRGIDDTIECVKSLGTAHRVIIVENGSADGSAERIREVCPHVHLIESRENLGFTGGNNLGIRFAIRGGAKFIFLLNNDTVVDPGAVDELVQVANSSPDYGMICPRIDYYDRPSDPWFVGAKLDLKLGEAVHDNSVIPSDVTELPWVTGCAMFCRAELLHQLQGFDERFFLNWEDVDLSLRAASFNWKMVIAPKALIRHKVSRSLSKVSDLSTYYWMRNRLLLTSIHSDLAATRRARKDNYIRALRSLWHREPNAWARFAATHRAIRDASSGRFGAITK